MPKHLNILSTYSNPNLWAQLSLLILLISSCVSSYEPIERFEEKNQRRKKRIETRLVKEYSDSTYQSLAYGPLIVYKPESFKQLDSLYALKDGYIDRNDLRRLENSGIEEKIPSYRAEAQQDIDKVSYEIEHVYAIKENDSINVHHTIFLFNHKDSITSIDELYSYSIPQELREMHTNYFFEYHFITNRNLYISRDEQDFINYFKSIEQNLAGTDNLQDFMINLLETMQLAQQINSVDYRDLIKYKSIQQLKKMGSKMTVFEFGTLIALKDENDQITGYEYSIKWQSNEEKIKKKSIFSYSPTLTLIEIETNKM